MEDLFPVGRVVATPGALRVVRGAGMIYLAVVHSMGDFGDVSLGDRAHNMWAATHGEPVVSFYKNLYSEPVFVVTEGDRSVTTIMLASER